MGLGKAERERHRGEPCVPDHKGHLLGRDVFGCDDEVALVFARGGVEDDYELAVSEGVDGIGDAVEVEVLRGPIGWHLRSRCCWCLVCLFEQGIKIVFQTVEGARVRVWSCGAGGRGWSLWAVLKRGSSRSSSAFFARHEIGLKEP